MKKGNLAYILHIPLFSAVICILSLISVPTPIPFTLQTLGIFISLMTLGGKRGTTSTLIYIAIGALGLPVFSCFRGGIGHIMEPSGGYIIGFIPLCLCYLLCSALIGCSFRKKLVCGAISLIPLYLCGVAWQCLLFTNGTFEEFLSTIATFVLPFIIPDLVKILVAAMISAKIERFARKRRGNM